MSKQKRRSYRRLLEKKKQELLEVLRRRESITIEGRMADIMDEIVVSTDRDIAIETLSREAALLAEVQLALNGVDGDGYGRCESCAEDISSRRLEAVPWARFCVLCQEQADLGERAYGRSAGPVPFQDAA